MNFYNVIGLMSGTSLDGIDIAFVQFNYDRGWHFKIIKAETIPYDNNWKEILKEAYKLSGIELSKLNNDYGIFLANAIISFLKDLNIKPDFIASHGHTIFHQPDNKLTLQIGNGFVIAAKLGIPVISDFRSLDIALGGQGAPLVPVGDKLLFNEYEYCINIGGICNISYKDFSGRTTAYDICPANMMINQLSAQLGYEFDEFGNLSKKGKINTTLYNQLNEIDYLTQPFPKSLGREDFDKYFLNILDGSNISVYDKLRTAIEFIAFQISKATEHSKDSKIMITGGGAFNHFLIERIKALNQNKIIIPDNILVNFKEAIIFGFLGVLRFRNEINCLSSVTGAKRDSSGGVIF